MTNCTNNRQTPRYGKLNAYGYGYDYDRGDFVFQVGKPDVPPSAAQASAVEQLCQIQPQPARASLRAGLQALEFGGDVFGMNHQIN
jgi:hypothetical protein